MDKYKDWEIDNSYSSDKISKFFKNKDERVEVSCYKDGIQVRIKNIRTPYQVIKGFSNDTKRLTIVGTNFYDFSIGIDKEYDENGKLIKEVDYDKPFKFSLRDVINKVKREYGFDLEDLTQRCVLERFEIGELDDNPFYSVYLRNKEDDNIMDYFIFDGNTGETLFKTYMALNGEGDLPPYFQYIESVKKTEQENKSYYKTYEGKDYTKEEWEAFEEKWYEDYKKKKNSKGFWDDIFKRP